MANYTTLLKTWGDTGSEYPDGYSYLECEQPVDAWDNYLIYNVVDDLQHLLDLTNDRVETDKGLAGGEPASPEASHLYHDTDNGRLSFWDAAQSEWHGLMKIDGDTMEGALNMGGYGVSNVGALEMNGNLTVGGTVDGVDVSVFKTDYDSHIHDGRYYTETESDNRFINEGDEVPHAVYASTADVPALNKGDAVYIDGDGLYVEDGS